ncbi:hypothetical protein [Methylobacterium sp. CM6244]
MAERTLTADDIERANRFSIGDRVTINSDSEKEWISDWARTEAVVVAVAVKWNPFTEHKTFDITIIHDGGQITDGFEPEDFSPLPAAQGGR